MMKLALILAVALSGTAAAQDPPKPPGLTPPGLTPPGQKRPQPKMVLKAVRPEKKAVEAGETIKVAFDLVVPDGWYTYPTYKKGISSPTTFTLEKADVAGKIEEPKPKIKKGTDIIPEYDYHVGTITMTVPVRLRFVTPAGKFTVKGVVDYQICNPRTCVPGKIPFSFDLDVTEADDEEPPLLKVLSVKPEKAEVKVGEVFNVEFAVEVPAAWHIYPTYKTTTGLPTEFKFSALEVAGKVEEPKAKVHPAGGENEPAYDYHDGEVTFKVPFYVKKGASPGALEVKGEIEYMICEFEGLCIPDGVPASFGLTVLEGEMTPPPPVKAAPTGQEPVTAAPTGETPSTTDKSFLVMLGFAFLGGFLLNLMPCVLPVLSIKLFSLVEQKDGGAALRHAAAIAYSAGVLVCLNLIALVVVILQLLGNQVGWGFQFQNPPFVIVLTTVIYVFSLSLFGIFELPALATGVAGKAGAKKGWQGHFITGLFVTLVATPCSAPFLGSALGYAFSLPPAGIFLFFSVVGFGLASPFLVIGFYPALFRLLPKPGPWLDVFKKIMAFTLIATAVWLTSVVGSLTGPDGIFGFLIFLTLVSAAAWIYGKWGHAFASSRSKAVSIAVSLVLIVAGGVVFLETEIVEDTPVGTVSSFEGLDYSKIPWQKFSESTVGLVRDLRKPGFIDFTADW